MVQFGELNRTVIISDTGTFGQILSPNNNPRRIQMALQLRY